MNIETAAASQSSDLPLSLWLRGDEEICSDFNVDADEAMGILGIKRSRLTQISGKELRVARRRVDRYIRPFYRRTDVDAYLQWARAPLSQAKPAAILGEAVEAMTREQETWQKHLLSLDLHLRQFMLLHTNQDGRLHDPSLPSTGNASAPLMETVLANVRRVLSETRELRQMWERQQQENSLLRNAIGELLLGQQSLLTRTQDMSQTLAQGNDKIEVRFTDQEAKLQQLSAAMDRLYRQISLPEKPSAATRCRSSAKKNKVRRSAEGSSENPLPKEHGIWLRQPAARLERTARIKVRGTRKS